MDDIIKDGDDGYGSVDPSSSGMDNDSSIYGGLKSKSVKNKSAVKSEITSEIEAAGHTIINDSMNQPSASISNFRQDVEMNVTEPHSAFKNPYMNPNMNGND
jgi:hypothetical protein